MKKFLTLLLTMALLLTMVGCGNSSTTNNEPNNEIQVVSSHPAAFTTLENIKYNLDGSSYFKDSVTNIMYLWYSNAYNGGLTEMSDPETGLPLTYARYVELYNETLVPTEDISVTNNDSINLVPVENDTSENESFCTNCGNQVSSNWFYCSKCGIKITE